MKEEKIDSINKEDLQTTSDANVEKEESESKKKNNKIQKVIITMTIVVILLFLTLCGALVALFTRSLFYSELHIKTNSNNCLVYVDEEKTNSKWLEIPNKQADCYIYDFDIYIEIDDSSKSMYEITFELINDKYNFVAVSSFNCNQNIYKATVVGGEKTKISSMIYFTSEEKVAKFDVTLNIDIKKID